MPQAGDSPHVERCPQELVAGGERGGFSAQAGAARLFVGREPGIGDALGGGPCPGHDEHLGDDFPGRGVAAPGHGLHVRVGRLELRPFQKLFPGPFHERDLVVQEADLPVAGLLHESADAGFEQPFPLPGPSGGEDFDAA